MKKKIVNDKPEHGSEYGTESFSGRIVVRVTRKHGSSDDNYFRTWDQAIAYMKRVRRFKTENQGEYFEISFGE